MKPAFSSFPSSGSFDTDYSNYWFYQSKSSPELWLRLEFSNWEDMVGSREAQNMEKYFVGVKELYIDLVSWDDLKGAMNYYGFLDSHDAEEITPYMIIEALFAYGCGDQTLDQNGNNSKDLLKAGRGEIRSSL